MNLTTQMISSTASFNEALCEIEHANNVDASATRQRRYDDISAMLDNCINYGTFSKNCRREVNRLNCDSDSTDLATLLDGVEIENTRSTASRARRALAQKCNDAVVTSGSHATYKTSWYHYKNHYFRTKTVAKHVFDAVGNELDSNQILRTGQYTAMLVDEHLFFMNDHRFYVLATDTPGKQVKRALKEAGFYSANTSTIMYTCVGNKSFEELVKKALDAIRLARSKEVSKSTRLRRIDAGLNALD